MKQIVFISGKGGTGKTVVSASFAALSKDIVMGDCDVDASNMHLLLKPEIIESHDFYAGYKARIDPDKCIQCGRCLLQACRFGAISRDFTVDEGSCEGCGACSQICPAAAVEMKENLSGRWFVSKTAPGILVHAKLGAGEDNSGKLVSKVREEAVKRAKEAGYDTIVIDGPPGTGCPVMAAITGTDLAVIVTEPTVSGMHDLERVTMTADRFGTPWGVIINKSDINPEMSGRIRDFCKSKKAPLFGEIEFAEEVLQAVAEGIPPVLWPKGNAAIQFKKSFGRITEFTGGQAVKI